MNSYVTNICCVAFVRNVIDIQKRYCFQVLRYLTHFPIVPHICVSKLTITGLENGRHQAIIWTNAGKFLVGPLRRTLNEIVIKINTFSITKMHLKLSPVKWQLFGLGLNVLMLDFIIYLLFDSRESTVFPAPPTSKDTAT